MKSLPVLVVLGLATALCAQKTLQGRLALNGSLEIDTTVRLSSAASVVSAPVLLDGSFALRVPAPGEYVLRVHSRTHTFLTYALRLTDDERTHFIDAQVYQPGPSAFKNPGAQVAHPLVLPAVGKTAYFEEPGAFNLYKIVMGNPLLLMLGVGVILTLTMPMLLKLVDPETMKEVAESQAEMHSKMAAFQNLDPTSAVSKFLAPVAHAGDEPPVGAKSGSKKRR